MAGPKKLTLRVQSSEGTTRIEMLDSDVTALLFEKVYENLRLNTFGFTLHKDRQRKVEVTSSKSRHLSDFGLQHGDMLYLNPVNGAVLFDQPSTSAEINNKPYGEPAVPGTSKQLSVSTRPNAPSEDEVDVQLYRLSGSIQRQRDDKLCRHSSKGCCIHCSPLEPFDEGYLKEHNIKHMSFHAYLRKMTSGNFISLEELSCKIKAGCKEHPPWPRGICSKCQPGAVTLNRQLYRHIDNVLFEHPSLVERFLAYWRATGHQRIGWLYGQYESHPDVPLGIRARVCAIYEPPQISTRDSISLQPDPKESQVEQLASMLGLRRVGWIFTDLIPEDISAGTVKQIRGVDTHFLSAQECIMAGHYQNEYPNACRYASKGHFGSKFATVCVTGDSNKQVHLEGYQVSGQCQALVRDEILLPTKDAPELGYIRDSSDAQYVPIVYYKERDVYGNEVGVEAKRIPVAYLLVDVPCGVSSNATTPLFSVGSEFPPANRPLANQLQTLNALQEHLQSTDHFLEAISDFHVLLYMMTNDSVPLSEETMRSLSNAVKNKDYREAERCRGAADFSTLERDAHLSEAAEGPEGSGSSAWTCAICTFHNSNNRESCEMCALPRGSV